MLGYSNLRKMRLPNVDVGNSVVAELMTMNCLLQQMQVHMTEQVQQTQHMVAREEELSVKQEQSHEALHMMMQQLSQQVMQQQQQHQQMMQQMMFQQQQSQQQQQTRQVQHQLLAQQHQQQQKQQQLLLEKHYDSLLKMRNPDKVCTLSSDCLLDAHMNDDDHSPVDDKVLPPISQGDHTHGPSFLRAVSKRMAALACQDQFPMSALSSVASVPMSALSSVASEWETTAGVDGKDFQVTCEVVEKKASIRHRKVEFELPDSAFVSTDGAHLITIPEKGMDPCAEDVPSPESKEYELLDAVQAKNAPLAMSILKRPSFNEVNKMNRHGQSALHMAACAGLDDVCMSILARPDFTQVNAGSIDGSTALHVAAQARLSVVCMVMLSRPDFTEVNAVDSTGKTALHIAASGGLQDVCLAILLASDFSQVNRIDKGGRSVLHAAACAGLREVCMAIP